MRANPLTATGPENLPTAGTARRPVPHTTWTKRRGLVITYNIRRYYDPQTGQFISVDPAVDQTEAPYAYVNGDPVNTTDRLGLGLGDLLNPWSPNNPIRQWAAGGSLASNILYLNPAFPAVAGYGAEAQAWENGCSLWTVAGYGAAGALGFASMALWFPTSAALPVAEDFATGFSEDTVSSAFQGMRSGGGHAMRHLIDEGLIPNAGSLQARAAQFEELTSPILTSPAKTFDWTVGGTSARAFAGEIAGRQVVVFVAKAGPYQGRVISTVVPDASQIARMGLR